MKAFLMYKGRDFDLQQGLSWNEPALTQDLELNILFNAMALGDKFLFEVAKKVILCGLSGELDTILYRQGVLKDCLKNPAVVRDIYGIAVEAIESKKKSWWGISSSYPSSILSSSVDLLQMFVDKLRNVRNIADEQGGKFDSEGFTAFFAMIRKELDDEYFASIQNHLRELKFRKGVLISAELGRGNEGTNYILRKLQEKNRNWMKRVFAPKTPIYTFHIADQDIAGGQALSRLRDRGINLVANAVAQSTEHLLNFFNMLHTELAFYIGCLNLYEQLVRMGEPVSFPLPMAVNERQHSFDGLYDICLALTMKQKVVGNDAKADNKDLMIITGANQGGKSTFLRSIGLAQLMMQCGMFVPAESFSANLCDGIFTHFKREEDITMKSGKLDEELSRMSEIADHLTSNSMLLFNESFAATNEREGSEIARQITSALLEKGTKVFFVTHLYEFARGFYEQKMENTIFLRAERQADGTRTFRLVEGEPLQTSYGEDLYNRIFGTEVMKPSKSDVTKMVVQK
jgi:DNA mismatch repair ATPase MutS